MQYAVTHILSDDGGADKVVAVVDGRSAGADTEHRPRYVRQAKHLASILMQHYPERLAAVWLVDLPTGVSSALQAVSKALPASTRAHLRCCAASDPRLPVTAEQLDKYAATMAPVRVSHLADIRRCPVVPCNDSRPRARRKLLRWNTVAA